MTKGLKALITGGLAAAILFGAQIAPARIVVESGMGTIGGLVGAGKLAGAVRLLKSEYRFDSPSGAAALRDFSLTVLHQALNDPDPYERCYAATSLAAYDDWSGRPIIAAALDSPNLLIQKAAVEGLAEAGNPEALSILERFYRLSGSVSQAIALHALAEVKAPAVMPILIEAATDPHSAGVFWAVNGLGRMGDRDALPYLHVLLVKSIDPMVRTEAAHSMILLGDRSLGMTDTLEEGLGSGDMEVAAEATLALGDAHDPTTVGLLKETVSNNQAADQLRIAAAVALTHFGNDEGLPMLMAALGDQRRRQDVLAMLDHLDFTVGRPLLLRALACDEPQVRLTAYEVIGRDGGEAEIGLLSDAIGRTTDPMDLAQIAWSLGRIGRPDSIPVLLNLVQNPAPEVRYTAAEALARIADKRDN
ncbi:MAG TPA: HEAT repeat domain-containing protein [Candidatus Binataceae bacterium]|nr:HEAT repeat domain-containing protein [Candidatus Binataceae bacterium]